MKVLVCGGRSFDDWSLLNRTLININPTEIIHGRAHGADALAFAWAEINRVKATAVPAEWGKHGKAAGPIRNQQMLDMEPDLVVAFPGGKGTADMVRRAKKAGVRVLLAIQ